MRLLPLIATITLTAMPVSAEESLFRKVSVLNLVTLDIPKHWKIRDENDRKNVAASAESRFNTTGHVASLSVVSLPEPSGGIIRVSFVESAGVNQQIFSAEVKRDKAFVKKELEELLVDEFRDLRRSFEKQGMRLLNGPDVEIINLSQKLGFALVYRRSGANENGAYIVTQFHVPLDRKKAIITLSYREHDQQIYRPIIQKVRNSIRF